MVSLSPIVLFLVSIVFFVIFFRVVITRMVVSFTLKAASKKKGLKKVVAKVITIKRAEGKYVVIISLLIFLFMTMTSLSPRFLELNKCLFNSQ